MGTVNYLYYLYNCFCTIGVSSVNEPINEWTDKQTGGWMGKSMRDRVETALAQRDNIPDEPGSGKKINGQKREKMKKELRTNYFIITVIQESGLCFSSSFSRSRRSASCLRVVHGCLPKFCLPLLFVCAGLFPLPSSALRGLRLQDSS